MAGNTDMIAQLLAQSGSSWGGSNWGGAAPVPEGMGDLVAKLRAAAMSPTFVPQKLGVAGKDVTGMPKPAAQTPSKLAEPGRTEMPAAEEMFKTPTLQDVAKQRQEDEAQRKAREALARAGAAGTAPPDAVAPTSAVATPTVAMTPTQGPDTGEVNPNAATGNQAEFIKTMTPVALQIAKETGLDPKLVIAQMGLETGWGKGVMGNNYFNIKSHGRPGGVERQTQEEVDGKMVPRTESFRVYATPEESAKDYVEFLRKNSRYAPVLAGKTLEEQLAALGKSGYATDSGYAAKLAQIIKTLPALDGHARGGPIRRADGGTVRDLLALSRLYGAAA